jgi:hypothetical protein
MKFTVFDFREPENFSSPIFPIFAEKSKSDIPG